MASKSYIRVTITAAGEARTIFSISEKKDGTVLLHLKSKYRLRPLGPHPTVANAQPMVKTQKYSIHPSPNSSKNINFIHHTIRLETGEKIHSRHVTRAIKNRNAFAFLFSRRCADLRLPGYESSETEAETISLGEYDPDTFTLMYAVVAGADEAVFEPGDHQYINVARRSFNKVQLTILWAFVSLPSHPTTLTGHLSTRKPDDPDDESQLDVGYDAPKCIKHFERECLIFDEELRNFTLTERCNFVPGQTVLVPICRFFKDGSAPSEAAREYLEALQTRVVSS